MIKLSKIAAMLIATAALAACSSTSTGSTNVSPLKSTAVAAKSSFVMDVTDIDYGSVTSDARYLVSYSFPNDSGRFAVRSTGTSGTMEPVSDTSDVKSVNDDVAASIICKDGLTKLQSKPTYIVADRAYQSTYACSNA